MTEENAERLRKKMVACNLRGVKCCANCAWREDDFVNDYTYLQWCGNPFNEDEEAGPGETVNFEVDDLDVCDRWKGKQENKEN